MWVFREDRSFFPLKSWPNLSDFLKLHAIFYRMVQDGCYLKPMTIPITEPPTKPWKTWRFEAPKYMGHNFIIPKTNEGCGFRRYGVFSIYPLLGWTCWVIADAFPKASIQNGWEDPVGWGKYFETYEQLNKKKGCWGYIVGMDTA